MYADDALRMLSDLFWVVVKIGAPVLGLSMLVGLVVSVLQVVTQVQEMSLTFVPKLLAAGIAVLVFGSWMVRTLGAYWHQLWASIPSMF